MENQESRIKNLVKKILKEMGIQEDIPVPVTIPQDVTHGDYTTNIAFIVAKQLKKSPMQIAEEISSRFTLDTSVFEKREAMKPGFINFWLSKAYLMSHLELPNIPNKTISLNVLVEYAHPNTHKEMHIGHMRTLITGEAISRILEANGATVFRANYQGDIGPHVAKALWGIQKLMRERRLSIVDIAQWDNAAKAHFLGEGYVAGSKLYEQEAEKRQIDQMNAFLYQKLEGDETGSQFTPEAKQDIWNVYKETKQWSLDYFDEFYKRFYTKFDRLFLESEMVACGKKIVKENIGKVFTKDADGSIILSKEKSGVHTRVFITQAGYPTYEGKEMCNGYTEWEAFHFDRKIHIVGSEQSGYFQVVFKALELLDRKKFEGKQYHLPMGMVQLTDRKISSRTGEILRVDWLIDEVKKAAEGLFKEGKIETQEKEEVLEQVAIAAVKYSVLKVGAKQDVSFDIQKSISLEGNSGPYIQYTYVRTQSIVKKFKIPSFVPLSGTTAGRQNSKFKISNELSADYQLEPEELLVLRLLHQFPSIVQKAAEELAPNTICTYLFNLAQHFNLFYQKFRIVDAKTPEEVQFRVALTRATGTILKQGLYLLGIEAPQKM